MYSTHHSKHIQVPTHLYPAHMLGSSLILVRVPVWEEIKLDYRYNYFSLLSTNAMPRIVRPKRLLWPGNKYNSSRLLQIHCVSVSCVKVNWQSLRKE